MLGYLKKFNNLPAELKQKVSSPKARAAIEELEIKYQLPLAALIMKVMVREIALADLVSFLLKENLAEAAAKQLAEELKKKIFYPLGGYFSPPASPALRPASQPSEPKPEAVPLPKTQPVSQSRPSVMTIKPSGQSLVKGASFFFSPDDEQEIRELASKIALAKKTELPAVKIEEKLAAIINRAQINFGSADLANRFKQILKTYLRGIRNRTEAELSLTKPFANGGLSFDLDSAQKVMDLADKILNSKPGSLNNQAGQAIKLPERIRVPRLEKSQKSEPEIIRDAPYDFSKLVKAGEEIDLNEPRLKSGSIQAEDTSHELAPLTPLVATDKVKSDPSQIKRKEPFLASVKDKIPTPARQTDRPGTVFKAEARVKPNKKTDPAISTASRPSGQADNTSQMPLLRRRFEAENLNQDQKVKVEDVKYIPRVMSPLAEIKYMNLVNFRRLDKDPLTAANKIKGKIDLLEEESYGKKLEAIKFWRSSPIYKLYLEIGHLSISGNKPVDVIIEERKMQASDYLSAAEFQAIMDLNKSLRF